MRESEEKDKILDYDWNEHLNNTRDGTIYAIQRINLFFISNGTISPKVSSKKYMVILNKMLLTPECEIAFDLV